LFAENSNSIYLTLCH